MICKIFEKADLEAVNICLKSEELLSYVMVQIPSGVPKIAPDPSQAGVKKYSGAEDVSFVNVRIPRKKSRVVILTTCNQALYFKCRSYLR